MAFAKEFKQGEDYEYSYTPKSPNEKLLASYGFYVENNPQSVAGTHFTITKAFFIKEKHDLCVRLNCFDQRFDSFYDDDAIQSANIQTFLNHHEINEGILNFLRLYVLPNHKFKAEHIYSILKKKRWISFDNELMALGYYRACIVYHFDQFKVKQVKIYTINILY